MRRTARAAIAAAIVILAAAGCSDSTPPVNTPSPLPVETATPTPTPTPTQATVGSRENPLAIGESRQLTDASGWIVGITESIPDALPLVLADNEYSDPPPAGHRFIAATVAITINAENMAAQDVDIANDGLDIYSSLEFEFVAADGTSYGEFGPVGTCYTGNDLIDLGTVYSAEAPISGRVCMVVPEEKIDGGLWRIANFRNEAVWVKQS